MSTTKKGLQPGTTYSVSGTNSSTVPTAKPSETPFVPKVGGVSGKGRGTISPKAAAAAAGNTGASAGVKPMVPGGPVTVSVDAQGNPIRSTTPLFQQGDQYTYLTSLPQAERAKIQKSMYSLGLYGKNFVPTYGFIAPGGEDATAIAKLMYVGEQLGKADINDVIKIAQKDSKIRTLLTTGGQVTQGTKISLTTAADAGAKLNSTYLDTFNEKPSKAELASFTNQLNAAEKKAKGTVSAQLADDIMMGVIAAKANTLISSASLGNTKAQAQLDAGQLGKAVRTIRSAYEDNGLPQPANPNDVYKKAVAGLRDNAAMDNVLQGIQVAAKNIWKPFAVDIANGHTVKDLINTHLGIKAGILGIAPSSIKISDMTDALDENGNLLTPDKYKSKVYGSNDYLASDNYKTQKFNDLRAVLNNFQIG